LQERDVEESLPRELDENDVNNIMLESDDYMESLMKEPNESSDSELVKKLLSESEKSVDAIAGGVLTFDYAILIYART